MPKAVRVSRVNGEIFSDIEKGELRIFGTRLVAIDAQSLCNHLDTLVGGQVAEVVMHNLEFRAGKLAASRQKTERPQATLQEMIEHFVRDDCLSGMGITKVVLPEHATGPIDIEISNPSVKGVGGAAKAFAFSWWAGVLTALLDQEMDVKNFIYYETRDMMRCQIIPRS